MRIEERRPRALRVTALLVVLALAGCAPTPVPTPATHSATDAPVFASDDAALAAATKAYAAYLTMSDQILMDGGAGPARIKRFVSDDLAKLEIKGYSATRSAGLRSTGGSKFSNVTIQDVEGTSRHRIVAVYLCSDVSAVDVVDANGNSVVSLGRPNRTPFEVTFDLVSSDPLELVVASAEVWDGPGIC